MSDTSDKKSVDKETDKKDATGKDSGKKSVSAAADSSHDAAKDKTKPSQAASAKSSSVPGSGSSTPPPKGQSQKSGGSGGRALFILILILLVIGGGAYATRDLWIEYAKPYLEQIPGYGLIASNDGSETSSPAPAVGKPSAVDALTDRVVALENMLASADGGKAMAALNEERERARAELNAALTRINDLERRLDEVRSLATAVTNSNGAAVDLEPILSRIDSIEKSSRAASDEIASLTEKMENVSTSGSGSNGQGAFLAVAQLRDAALSGRPYQSQLTALNAVAVGNSELMAAATRLRETAASGLPSVAALEAQFSGIAGDIVAQTRAGSDDWVDQALGQLSTLVSLRRTDGGSGNVVEDTVATIVSDLKGGDVGAAVKSGRALYDVLEPGVQKVLEPWLLEAERRALAERALDAMHASALAALGR